MTNRRDLWASLLRVVMLFSVRYYDPLHFSFVVAQELQIRRSTSFEEDMKQHNHLRHRFLHRLLCLSIQRGVCRLACKSR